LVMIFLYPPRHLKSRLESLVLIYLVYEGVIDNEVLEECLEMTWNDCFAK
jgi:hypothetical protein